MSIFGSVKNNISTIYLPNQNIGGLYLGDLVGANQVQVLHSKCINSVITVAGQTNLRYTIKNKINHHIYEIYDNPSFNFLPYFETILDLIHKYR